jgi:prepilin-type N-terminal cleavage/methylation domain-containing protein
VKCFWNDLFEIIKMHKKKSGFTLIELLISMTIIGILIVVLFRAYNTISQVSFRAHQEKVVQQEAIRIAQTLQNIADNNTIDRNTIQTNDQIILTGKQGSTIITATGLCIPDYPPILSFSGEARNNPCQLIILQNNKTIAISSSKEIIISKPIFTIFPRTSNESIISGYQGEANQNPPFLEIRQPAFQVHFSIYTP